MILRPAVLPLVLLAGCAMTWSSTRVESAVVLAPGQHATLHLHGASQRIRVKLRGAGAGTVGFSIRADNGRVLAHGALDADSSASTSTDGSGLVVELTAGDRGGTVDYTAHGDGGLGVDLAVTQR